MMISSSSNRTHLLFSALFLLFALSFLYTNTVLARGEDVARSTSPVTVVDRAAIESTGTQSVGDLINTLPQIHTPSTSTGSSLNLRGLGTDRNLVLINGRRIQPANGQYWQPQNSVDLNTVPTSLIDRVEVLTGGTSAVYGTDAVSGVINFITASDGFDSNVQYDSSIKDWGVNFDSSQIQYQNPTIAGFSINTQWDNSFGGVKPYDWKVSSSINYNPTPQLSLTGQYTSPTSLRIRGLGSCKFGTGPLPSCEYGCEYMDGGVCVFDYKARDGTDCYYCDDPYDCEEAGQVCSCSFCLSGTRCVTGTIAYDAAGRSTQCYECVPNVLLSGYNFSDRQYFAPILQTPSIRYILAKEVSNEKGFQPTQILALASADSKAPDMGQSHQDVQAISKIFGMSSGTMGTLQAMAGQIRESLDKSRKYSDSCFSEIIPSQPNQKPAGGDASSGGGSGSAFGEDGSKDYIVNGPVLACGQFGDKSVVAVYDANGALMGMLPQETMADDPELLYNLLQLAERSNEEIDAISQRANNIQKADAKGVKKSGGIKEGPDDQLFQYSKKKKKKGLLGMLGGGDGHRISLGGGGGDGAFGPLLTSRGEAGAEANDQWGLHMIGFTHSSDPNSAWHEIAGAEGGNVVVAVIDSGLDMNHPDGPSYIWYNRGEIPNNRVDDDANGYVDDYQGWSFLTEGSDVTDYNGHGTFVAGVIAAKRNNGIGIAGINPGAVIMPLKVANEEGVSVSLAVYRAIHYAVNNGARVINVSLGARGISALEQSAINYAHAHGVFVAVASGNNGLYIGELGPASAKRSFTVGAVDMDGLRSTISSWGPNNAIMAPGESVYSIRSQDSMGKRAIKDEFARYYHTMSGTSFSTPMVSATASLLLARDPKLTGSDIADLLVKTATDMDDPGWDDMTGAGLLNATAAFKAQTARPLDIKIVEFRQIMDDRGRLTAIDVFGTVAGSVKEYTVSLGKGKRAKKFKQVAGPFKKEAKNVWLTRINVKENLRGSKEWIVKIQATDRKGKAQTAQALLSLKKNPTR